MLFNVSAYCHTPIDTIEARSITWLFDWHERVARARWQDFVTDVLQVEVGVMRAMSAKKPRRLPTYEEIYGLQEGHADDLPDWMADYEAVNVGRLASDRDKVTK